MPAFTTTTERPLFQLDDFVLNELLEEIWGHLLLGKTYTAGDFLRAASATSIETVAIGSSGTVIRSNGTLPVYSAFTIADTYVAGDLPHASAANALTGLAIGSAGQVLGISSGLPAWQTPSTYLAHNLLSATHGDTVTATPTAGDIIFADATPNWNRLAIGAQGAIIFANATPLPEWLAIGSAGDVLQVASGVPTWSTTLTGTYTFSGAGTPVTVNNNALISGHLRVGTTTETATAGEAAFGLLAGPRLVWDTGSEDLLLYNSSNQLEILIDGSTPAIIIGRIDGTESGLRLLADQAGPDMIQAGDGSGDTSAELRFARAFTLTTEIATFQVYATNANFSNQVRGGTATDTANAGDYAFGLTGAARTVFDQTDATVSVFDSSNVEQILLNADGVTDGFVSSGSLIARAKAQGAYRQAFQTAANSLEYVFETGVVLTPITSSTSTVNNDVYSLAKDSAVLLRVTITGVFDNGSAGYWGVFEVAYRRDGSAASSHRNTLRTTEYDVEINPTIAFTNNSSFARVNLTPVVSTTTNWSIFTEVIQAA